MSTSTHCALELSFLTRYQIEDLHITHELFYLFDEVNAGLEVKSKVNECPLDALCLVLLLFHNEHGMVEQLLQLLVGVVDAQLFK